MSPTDRVVGAVGAALDESLDALAADGAVEPSHLAQHLVAAGMKAMGKRFVVYGLTDDSPFEGVEALLLKLRSRLRYRTSFVDVMTTALRGWNLSVEGGEDVVDPAERADALATELLDLEADLVVQAVQSKVVELARDGQDDSDGESLRTDDSSDDEDDDDLPDDEGEEGEEEGEEGEEDEEDEEEEEDEDEEEEGEGEEGEAEGDESGVGEPVGGPEALARSMGLDHDDDEDARDARLMRKRRRRD